MKTFLTGVGIKVLVRLQMSLCLGMDLLYKNLLNTHTTDAHCTGRTEACPGEDQSPGACLWNKGWLWAVVTPEVRGIWNGGFPPNMEAGSPVQTYKHSSKECSVEKNMNVKALCIGSGNDFSTMTLKSQTTKKKMKNLVAKFLNVYQRRIINRTERQLTEWEKVLLSCT